MVQTTVIHVNKKTATLHCIGILVHTQGSCALLLSYCLNPPLPPLPLYNTRLITMTGSAILVVH